MSASNETFIVRVRRIERDAIVEQPSRSRRRRLQELSGVGELIALWLDQVPSGGTGAAARRDAQREEMS